MASSRRPQDTLFSRRQNRRHAALQPKAPPAPILCAAAELGKGGEGVKEKKLSVDDIIFPVNYDWTREVVQDDESDTAISAGNKNVSEYNRLSNFYAESESAEQAEPLSHSRSPSHSPPPPPQLSPAEGDSPHPTKGRIAKRIGNHSTHNSDDEDQYDNKNTANAKKQRKSSGGSSSSGREYEKDPATLQRRQKQIDFGKNTIGYDNYLKLKPKNLRSREDPKTPTKHLKYSRRSWDALIHIWRKSLHNYDTPEVSSKMDADTQEDK